MLVGINVIQFQARGGKAFELGSDFVRQLPAHILAEKHRSARPGHVIAEIALGIHQVRHSGRGQDRLAVHQHQMQAHAQFRQCAGAGHRIGGGGARHHQAGGGQNAMAMGALHRFVYLRRRAEIVGGYNQALQAACWRRSFRKWKNSTPSRNRRFIMSGWVTISLTMEPILLGRK